MRRTPLVLGMLVLTLCWVGPLSGLARHSFYGHMIVHMSVVAIAAPLLALAVAGTVWDPAPRWPVVFSPLLASLWELAIVWLWHTPALHHVARVQFLAFAAEQATFLLSGLVLWLAAFGGRSFSGSAAGVVALLLTAMHMTLLGALLALSPRPLYLHFHASGLSPLDDQHLGGAIMLVVGGISYIAGGLYLSARLISASREMPEARADRHYSAT